jgi:hypothetical protein
MRAIFILILIFGLFDFTRSQSSINNQITQNAFQEFSAAENSKMYSGSSIPVFNHLEDTRGTRYLYDQWVHGLIVNAKGDSISNDSFYLNYDKISESLFLTMDKKTVIEINKKEIRAFTLWKDGKDIVFQRVYLIDNKNLFQVLIHDSVRYSLFKLYHTKFRKADYTNDGIHESGKNYNEFVDAPQYFVLYPDRRVVEIIEPSRKAIGKAFNLNPLHDKVLAYLSAHPHDEENEELLTKLVQHLNQ